MRTPRAATVLLTVLALGGLTSCTFGAPTTEPDSAASPSASARPASAPSASPRPTSSPAPTVSPSPTSPPTDSDGTRGSRGGRSGGGNSGGGGGNSGGGGTPQPQPTTHPTAAPTPTPTPTPTVPPACPTSSTDPIIPVLDFGSIAAYSTTALAQGQDCTGFRSFLSTGLPQYDSQSFEFFGHLVDDQGETNSIALMSQGNTVIPGLQRPWLTLEESGLIFNRLSLDQGPTFGGIDGLANITVPTTISYAPWNIHVEQQNTGDPEQIVDMRVVSGAVGAVGSVYQLTVSVETGMAGSPAREWTTLSVRAKDVTGIIQWGYGPNGFFPLWMFDGDPLPATGGPIPTTDQRTPIMNQYGGDIGAYLQATGDPMTGQGSHYYSMPLVEVEQWSVQIGSTYVASGTDGLLFFDNLTETYNDAAQYVVGHGYEWTEFSVQLADSLQGMLIATTGQQEVGELHYAMIGGAGSSQSANGTLQPTANWPQGAIHITPTSNTWTSPHSCYVYHLDYNVQLDGSSTRPGADLVFSATASDQELNALNRAVYEGLFSYSGTLAGEAVSGYAWGEIQGVPPTGNPVPPNC